MAVRCLIEWWGACPARFLKMLSLSALARNEWKMRTNNCQTAANATTLQGLQVVVRTLQGTMRHLIEALIEGMKRGYTLCARLWYLLVPAAPVVVPVAAMEQKCSTRHQVQRPDRRSYTTPLLRNVSGNVSIS